MTPSENPGEITRFLHAWQGGHSQTEDRHWPVLYDELKNLARGVLRRQGRGAREQATSLVNKAYLRLLGTEVDWSDRKHFFAVAARAMRFILTDEARRQLAKKRGAGETLNLDDSSPEAAAPAPREARRAALLRRLVGRGDGGGPRGHAAHRGPRLADGASLAPRRAGGGGLNAVSAGYRELAGAEKVGRRQKLGRIS